MNYSLKQLRVFVAIARHGSFSRAGEAIGLTQSAVSHSVKELEAEVGVRLLDRGSNGCWTSCRPRCWMRAALAYSAAARYGWRRAKPFPPI